MNLKVLKDDPAMWPGIPLAGHICCMGFVNEKHYWTVEHLIELNSQLPVPSVPVDSLIDFVRRGKWLQPNLAPTITDILDHISRAMNADVKCPISVGKPIAFLQVIDAR